MHNDDHEALEILAEGGYITMRLRLKRGGYQISTKSSRPTGIMQLKRLEDQKLVTHRKTLATGGYDYQYEMTDLGREALERPSAASEGESNETR